MVIVTPQTNRQRSTDLITIMYDKKNIRLDASVRNSHGTRNINDTVSARIVIAASTSVAINRRADTNARIP